MKLPTNKEELFRMIDRHVKVDERKELAFAEDLSAYHWGLGLWIRKRFVYPSNGEVGRLLGKGGVYGPADVISEEILRAYRG